MRVAVTSGPRSRRICFRRRMWKKQALATLLMCRCIVNSESNMTPRSRTASTGVTTSLPTCSSDRSLAAIFLRLTVNRTRLVQFSTDSAGDVWRHTSHQQQSHIAEDGRWWMTRRRSLHSQIEPIS